MPPNDAPHDDPPLDYADPNVRSAGTGRPLRSWLILLTVWTIGLAVWALYLAVIVMLWIRLM